MRVLIAAVTWSRAVVRTARPQQWPKNLLVAAAPLAAASLGRDDGLAYTVVAFVVFCAASSAVYLVNDVIDIERDRLHPRKQHRPLAAGVLSRRSALVVAAVAATSAVAAGLAIDSTGLVLAVCAYLAISLWYCTGLKHVPFVEMGTVASGFLLRALGGAAATRVAPSGWFLLVCALGALLVAVAKRSAELDLLGAAAAAHRPTLSRYRAGQLRSTQVLLAALTLVAYAGWAVSEPHPHAVSWHLVSLLPLAACVVRFLVLVRRTTTAQVEELLTRDRVMLACELAWLVTFAVGLGE